MAVKSLKEQLEEAKILAQSKDKELQKLALEEVKRLELVLKKIPKSENAILEIRAGTGGDEAELFAAQLLRMYQKFTQISGWKVEILDSNITSLGGVKEAVLRIIGPNAFSKLKYEAGGHRVQRIPKTEKRGRVHTSVATVAVLPEIKEQDLQIKPEDIRVDVYRSTGHGGQGVNTTDSAVRITHLPTGIVVSCQDERSQIKNRAKALMVLRAKLWQRQSDKRKLTESKLRSAQIGTGERSEKIRTYNFPQDRITDHRINKSWGKIEKILDGNLEPIISLLQKSLTITYT